MHDALASLVPPAPALARAARRAVVVSLTLCTVWWPSAEPDAAVHVCRSADGTTVYQDRPCRRKPHVIVDDTRAWLPPAGMHPSWFERPEEAGTGARCDERGCACGTLARPFEAGLAIALSDALYIDGAWLRYEMHRAVPEKVSDTAAAARARRRELRESVCDVLMSQQTLRRFTERVFGELRSRKRAAEARGFDTPAACERGDAEACAYRDDVMLYERMLTDLAALRQPRTPSGTAAD